MSVDRISRQEKVTRFRNLACWGKSKYMAEDVLARQKATGKIAGCKIISE